MILHVEDDGGLGSTVGRLAAPDAAEVVVALFGPEGVVDGEVRKDLRGLRHRLLLAAQDAREDGRLEVVVGVEAETRRARVLTDVRTFLVRLGGTLEPIDLARPFGPVTLPNGDALVVEVRAG